MKESKRIPPPTQKYDRWKRASQHYKSSAVIFLNSVILFIVLNLILSIFFAIYRMSVPTEVETIYEKDDLKKVYPKMSEKQISNLLQETWKRPLIFEPFTGFKERTFSGTYVNVSDDGWRSNGEGAHWPPIDSKINIFVFGGSTTFGYGVSDAETIPAQLGKELRLSFKKEIAIYNFGRGNYYSTQERILFENLLIADIVPDIAVFIDGLNDITHPDNRPEFAGDMEQFMNNVRGGGQKPFFTPDNLPIARLAKYFLQRLKQAATDNEDIAKDVFVAEKVIKQYLQNKKMIESISQTYGVVPFFVWQPIPAYKYDVSYHLFAKNTSENSIDLSKITYQTFAKQLSSSIKKRNMENFFWAANIQESLKKPLYVDAVHYTAQMNQLIAQEISTILIERKIIQD